MSPVQASPLVQQPSAWRTKPVMSNELYPEYHFRSTSTYAPIVGHTSYMASEPYNPSQAHGPNRACKDYDPWGDTDPSSENGVGEVDDPAPIGSPLVLLLMAVLYIFYTNRKKIYEKFAQFKKM